MSDTIVKLIPEDVSFMPANLEIDQARTFLESLFPTAVVSVEKSEKIQFVDQGENFIKITCPICETNVDLEWWHDAMDTAWRTFFEDLHAQLPCCLSYVSLHDLKYDWPVGFSRIILSIENPESALQTEQVHELKQIIGGKLRQVIAHI